ncbi:hypothetical protein M728_005665 (plasmid) [Ensifer sp. WSM1721]|uniref:hypothetical protein n=1 Tax=Ensifer sp. WSM1721 TaxID=1041159 RepID=UPI0004B964EE|nr:hypothetical protein [Ensifer sp. WSM1721]
MTAQFAKRLGYAAASVVALAAGAASAAPAPIEAMNNIAASIDANIDGVVTAAEHLDFTVAAFVSMDTDETRTIEENEFLGWDMGFAYIADGLSKLDTYGDVKADVFAAWDADGDGAISFAEANEQAATEFINSDADGNSEVVARDLATGSTTFAALLTAVRL